jgi:IS1 family transposase
VRHLERCVFYTDKWNAFDKVMPPDRYVVGKKHTAAIERDNSNTRHRLARFTRLAKVVLKTREIVDLTLRLWHRFTYEEWFTKYQELAWVLIRTGVISSTF